MEFFSVGRVCFLMKYDVFMDNFLYFILMVGSLMFILFMWVCSFLRNFLLFFFVILRRLLMICCCLMKFMCWILIFLWMILFLSCFCRIVVCSWFMVGSFFRVVYLRVFLLLVLLCFERVEFCLNILLGLMF